MKEAKKIVDLIQNSDRIVITSHIAPDGDSIGSSIGLYQFIKKLNRSAHICHPDPCPEFLNWAKDDLEIVDFENNEESVTGMFESADLIFCLDYNEAGRLGKQMGLLLTQSTATKVMIDHHLNPDDFVDVVVSEPSVCSTSQLIYELIAASDNLSLLDAAVATPLYLGIMTDTGSFRYASVTERTHNILADLIRVGVDHTSVHENTFDNNRIDRLKLRAHIIAERLEIMERYNVAIISVTNKELDHYNFVKGDTEGLVNVALSIEGIKVAAFFTAKMDVVKISLRSKGNIPVNDILSEHFEGGGHMNAAGGVSNLDLALTIAKFKELVPKYFQ
jgi:phosphoesterase RecJ-like protein